MVILAEAMRGNCYYLNGLLGGVKVYMLGKE